MAVVVPGMAGSSSTNNRPVLGIAREQLGGEARDLIGNVPDELFLVEVAVCGSRGVAREAESI